MPRIAVVEVKECGDECPFDGKKYTGWCGDLGYCKKMNRKIRVGSYKGGANGKMIFPKWCPLPEKRGQL